MSHSSVETISDAQAGLGSGEVAAAERQRARVSIAEAAISGGWEHDLGEVLLMLGLGES